MDNSIVYLITVLVGVLVILIASAPLARVLHLPQSFILIVIGFVGSELLVSQGIDTGIRWTNFRDLIFYVLLPALIFDAAFRMDIAKFIENLIPILVLAIPLLLVATFIGAAVIYFMVGSPQGFPWIAALLAGALIAPTDPTAIVATEKHSPLPTRLKSIIEGESLLNDATAIILFLIIVSIGVSLTNQTFIEVPYANAIFNFLLVFFGGGALGAIIAIPGCILLRRLKDTNAQIALTVICSYGSYLLAESENIHVSGIMAVLVCGIMMGAFVRRGDQEKANSSLNKVWSFIAYLSESAIFLLAGITITTDLFTQQWLAMLIGIIAALISRSLIIYGSFPFFNRTTYKADPIRLNEQHIISLGGVRGALTMALALSLPLTLDYWFTVQAIAYGVVLFTLLGQTSALGALVRKVNR